MQVGGWHLKHMLLSFVWWDRNGKKRKNGSENMRVMTQQTCDTIQDLHSSKKKEKEKSVSQLSCTQFIIQQKEKHNTLRTEDGKIPHGDKVGGKTNLRRHLKAKQTALLFVWISQLTGMLCDQFLMTNMFKRCRTGRAGHAFCMLTSPRNSQGRIGRWRVDRAVEQMKLRAFLVRRS